MIGWIIEQIGGFVWTCVAILLFCETFGIPIHLNMVP